jgi:hypothetical protein
MMLPLLFCCAETAGAATLSCWLLATAERLALTLHRQCCSEQRDRCKSLRAMQRNRCALRFAIAIRFAIAMPTLTLTAESYR